MFVSVQHSWTTVLCLQRHQYPWEGVYHARRWAVSPSASVRTLHFQQVPW